MVRAGTMQVWGGFGNPDPIIEKFAYLTPFNYASNSPVSKIDLYGLQGLDVNSFMGAIMGVGTAIVEDLTGADFPAPQGNDSYSSSFRGAEEMGHIGMAVTGAGLAVLGGEMIVGGGAATLTGVGATVGVPAAGTGAAVAAGGGWIAANATRNMKKDGGDATKPDAAVGVIYQRVDKTGKQKDYIGQSKSQERYKARQKEHKRANKKADYEFAKIDEGTPGKNLDQKEQKHLDRMGGPTNKSNPNGGTSNKKDVITKN